MAAHSTAARVMKVQLTVCTINRIHIEHNTISLCVFCKMVLLHICVAYSGGYYYTMVRVTSCNCIEKLIIEETAINISEQIVTESVKGYYSFFF